MVSTRLNIIKPAWELIQNDSKIKNMYFFPGLLSIVFLTILLVYQSIYTYVVILHKKNEALKIILDFFHSDYIIETLITAIIFLILYLIIIPIFEGALIKYLDKKSNCQDSDIECSDSLSVGLYKFMPMFKYGNLFSEFKFMSVVNAYLFSIRFIGVEYIKSLSYIFLSILLFSAVINIMLAYSKYIIILENKGVFESISKSIKLSILSLWTTTKLYLFMFILNIRVIINFIVFLSFPVIIVISIGLITSQIFVTITVTILVIIFVFLTLFLGYLAGVLEVFKSSIWYFAYRKVNKKYEELKDGD